MRNNHGFTLIELIVVLAVFTVIGTATMKIFVQSTRTSTSQTLTVRTQQNVRVVMDYLANQIRMAGFNNQMPMAGGDAGASITTAQAHNLAFTADMDEDGNIATIAGTVNELFDIRLLPADDADNNGVADAGVGTTDLVEAFNTTGALSYQAIAENIHAIAFSYAVDADDNGEIDTYPVGGDDVIAWVIPDAGGINWQRLDFNADGLINAADDTDGDNVLNLFNTGFNFDPDDIRAVRVTLLGAAPVNDVQHRDTNTYVVGTEIITVDDNLRRELLTSTIFCRNMRF